MRWVETRVSDVIHMIDGREGTDVLSVAPGSQGLFERDQGRARANVGEVIAVHPRDGEELEIAPGDYVFYGQEGAHRGMCLRDAQRFAELSDREGFHFFVHAAEIPAKLPEGAPAAGTVR